MEAVEGKGRLPVAPSNRHIMMDYIERSAQLIKNDTLYSIEELTETAILKTSIVDIGKDVPEYREIMPTLYTFEVRRKTGLKLASLAISDSYDGFAVLKERHKKKELHDDLSRPEVDTVIGDFMARWHIFAHINRQ